ncbi:mechanosensitive ion channel domain-containing protein [Acidihalobacter ferrooxydans]|uniref:Small-conductance mechanosensitive channel n=1 Tax=Acidihalobacter ferrooxydans TaxID=1765967 RepID=A0A1P8UK58_9GAMM|nr:mechanosensitive ion channel domain-containing protein [Acidihalobacter ferrooxydans]APZ44219.1 hypothetical protein BW247_14920 [Acidihalobacter ferrooxydans]
MDAFGVYLPAWLPSWQRLLPAVLLFIAVGFLIVLVQRALARALARAVRQKHLPTETALILRRSIGLGLWLLLILSTLRHVGVNVDGLWTLLLSTLAVIGVGLLAVWTMISNFTASFFIWIWRPYELGDKVELIPDGFKGRVVDRNLMFTAIREEDGSVLMVPNNFFFQKVTRRAPDDVGLTELERLERGEWRRPSAEERRHPKS